MSQPAPTEPARSLFFVRHPKPNGTVTWTWSAPGMDESKQFNTFAEAVTSAVSNTQPSIKQKEPRDDAEQEN